MARRSHELPHGFHASVDEYLARCKDPDPFDFDQGRALAVETIRNRRSHIFLGANYLLDRGWPSECLETLRSILQPKAIREIFIEHFQRHSPDGKTWPAGATPMASSFGTMARQLGGLSESENASIRKLLAVVRSSKRTFPKKTRERLAVFDDERVLRKFFELPAKLWARSLEQAGTDKPRQAHAAARAAIALAILLTKPLRIGELASIDYKTDFRRNARGQIVGLAIPGERTKTGIPIEADIDHRLARRISEYLDLHVIGTAPPSETFLFPREKSGHVSGANLGSAVQRQVWRHLGITFNCHLARALVATIVIDADPHAVVIAQRLLEHSRVETTIKHYGMQRGRAAQRQYTELVERITRGRKP